MKKTLEQWLNWQETLHLSEIDLGLDRIRQVAEKLKLLSPTFPIITVAGTNGKGSTVAFLDAILVAQGYRTGNYTSPHLISYNERIKINGTPVSDDDIIQAFEIIDAARGTISLTYFEFGTLAALLIFAQKKVDVAILEVGLGGRLDAANLWDASLAIITSIAIDHVSWLGNNRETIAIEKAGIMRQQLPVICGDPNPPASIASEANRIGARLYQLNKDFNYTVISPDTWQWQGWNTSINLPYPALKGIFQLNHAATAIAGLKTIDAILPTTDTALRKGLQNVTLAGRMQQLSESPEWLIDVAHNPHAALELRQYLKKHPIQGKTRALFSMLSDKDIQQVVSIMEDSVDEWHIISLEGARGIQADELKNIILQQNKRNHVIVHASLAQACEALKNISKIKDRVVAFGSFLVVSDVIAQCKPKGNS